MSGLVEWIGAAAEEGGGPETIGSTPEPADDKADASSLGESTPATASWSELPAHNFPVGFSADTEEPSDRNPDLWMYRDRTAALLRRYMRFSLETGRLPSLLGREFFRAKMTAYTATTFEDRVILVRDVEKCLNRLQYWDQQLIARVILQEYSFEQAAYILHVCRKTVQRRLPEVLDLLSEDFLRVQLLSAVPPRRKSTP